LVAAAIHNGHAVRKERTEFLAVNDWARLREEEPHTGDWTAIAPTRIIGLRSRFEVDLNRPPETAIYARQSVVRRLATAATWRSEEVIS
jgi:hypothetical protein